ncbi:MAG: AI-2E family transporter [Alphaproteobacteria bacterium]|nr:AI-2E family transporter [Alphaproteobacteria bacterium]
MTPESRRAWLWGGVLAALLILLWLAWPILTPFLAAVVIAYLLDPLVTRIERLGAGRTSATALVTIAFALLTILALAIVVPLVVRQIPGLIEFAAGAIAHVVDRVRPIFDRLIDRAGGEGLGPLGQIPGGADVAGQAVRWFAAVAAGLVSGGIALVNVLSLIFVTPVVVFYLLRDWWRIMAQIESWLPRDHAATIVGLVREMDERMAGFLRGQGLVCLFLGVFYAVGLAATGLRYGILVGMLSGLVTFIPYVGVLLGAATGISMAFFQFSDWWQIGAVIAVFAIGQFLEGNFVSPKLVGERVGLHPVWVMVALLVGGVVGGLVGVMLAVPAAAAIGVLARFMLGRYLASPLYRGRGGESA